MSNVSQAAMQSVREIVDLRYFSQSSYVENLQFSLILCYPQNILYSVNEGNQKYWEPAVQRYVDFLKSPEDGRKPYSTRYIGSLVADFHRTLCYGGIFAYPADFKDPEKPKGKLRLLYEASPLAMIVEQAGGAASTGRERILDIRPTEIHQRVPLFIGSKTEVEWAEEFIAGKR